VLRFIEEQKMNNSAGVVGKPDGRPDSVAAVSVDDRLTRIRSLNDRLRMTGRGGMILMTDGIAALGREAVERVFDAVRRFDRFDEGNDPHGEHDFGGLEVDGRSVFWKIDLYEDPDVKDANGEPQVTRVLTLMLAHEW